MTMQSQPLYQQTFGTDFDLGIEIPSSWMDTSYKNDVSPSFMFKDDRFPFLTWKLWVDHADVDQREISESNRYIIELYEAKEGDDIHRYINVIFTGEEVELVREVIKSKEATFNLAESYLNN